jgi:hypothetical protein
MREFEPLIGEWHGVGEVPAEPPLRVSVDAGIERLGRFIVFRTVGEPAEMPDSISIVGGAPDSDPQPMRYFDSRGVARLFMMTVEGSTWRIWRAPGEDWNGLTAPASTSASSGRSRSTAGRSRVAGSGVWVTPATSGSSISRSITPADRATGYWSP